MTITFDKNNTFRNIGIHNANNELIVMNINASTDNISLHSSNNSSNVDTLSIKNILHKDINKDLNICGYNNNINPIIQINNTHQHVNITNNLNIASNLNVSEKIKAQEIKINGIFINTSTGKFNEFSETTKTYTTTIGTINSKVDTVTNLNNSPNSVSIRVIDMDTSQQDLMQPMYVNPASGSTGNYTTTNITSGVITTDGTIDPLPPITATGYDDHNNINFTSEVSWVSLVSLSDTNINDRDYFIKINLSMITKIYGIVTWPRKGHTTSDIYVGVNKFAISYSDDDVNYKFVCHEESNIYHRSKLCFGPNSTLSSNDPQPIEFLANDYASSFSEKPDNWETKSQVGVANYFNIKAKYVRVHIREKFGNRNQIHIRAHVIVDSSTNFPTPNFNTGLVTAGGLSSIITTLGVGFQEFQEICKIGRTNNSELRFLNNFINGFRFVKNSTGIDEETNTDLFKITGSTTSVYNQLDSKHQIRINTLNETSSKTTITNAGGVFSADTAYSARFYCGQSRYIDITGYLDSSNIANIYPTIATSYANLYIRCEGNAVGYFNKDRDYGPVSFTGQHRSKIISSEENFAENYIGMIVVSTGEYNNLEINENKLKPSINESLPIVELSKKKKDKSVFGVLSECEDINSSDRLFKQGSFVSIYEKEKNDNRVYINSLGEGAIWIVNTNGNLENGDYIQSSDVIGHGEKQTSEFLANYTVAKITMNCNFDINSNNYDCVEFIDSVSGNTYRKAFVGCTYHCG